MSSAIRFLGIKVGIFGNHLRTNKTAKVGLFEIQIFSNFAFGG